MSNKEQKSTKEKKKPKTVDKKSKDKTPKYMSGGALGDAGKGSSSGAGGKK